MLSAMASAGQQCGAAPHSGFVGESIPESVEHKGLGTPATRAGIIEKLVRGGYVRRQQRQLVPTEKGLNLIAVLPEAVKSPALTAEWEEKLLHIERGQLDAAMFMEGIAALTHGLVQEHTAANPEYAGLFASAAYGEVVGICPRCGKTVRENKKGFVCENRACGFAMWKDNRFFAAKKKALDKKAASALLKEGRVFMPGLYSEKTGKTYDAHILLADTGKYVNFKLEF